MGCVTSVFLMIYVIRTLVLDKSALQGVKFALQGGVECDSVNTQDDSHARVLETITIRSKVDKAVGREGVLKMGATRKRGGWGAKNGFKNM